MRRFALYQSEILNDINDFIHVFGGRGFDTDSPASVPEMLRFLGIPPDRIFTLRQVHSAEVVVVGDDDLPRRGSAEGDGIVCLTPGMGAAVLTADCLPVIIVSQSSPGFAIIHGGWRGLQAGVIENGLELFLKITGVSPRSLRAAVGPGASVCCYEVGWDVAGIFAEPYPENVRKSENDGYMLDLKGISGKKLVSAGLLSHNIDMGEVCTICNEHFHSVRRDRGIKLRQISVGYVP